MEVGLTPDSCEFVLVFEGRPSRGNMKRRTWCLTHDRFAEECGGDGFDVLAKLDAEAQPKAKLCPHCGGELERS